MARTPEENVHYLVREVRKLKYQRDQLFKELGWSDETITKWKRGEFERDTD